jgi:hypothetical protein
MRDEVMCDRATAVAGAIGGEEAELRAGLLGACMIGLGHGALRARAPGLATASREDVVRLMEPALRALVDPPD